MKSGLQIQTTQTYPHVRLLRVLKPSAAAAYLQIQRLQLSARELQTLKFLSHGLTSYDIAAVLNLSPETVDTHRKNIMRKLNATNIVQAVADSLRNKIIE